MFRAYEAGSGSGVNNLTFGQRFANGVRFLEQLGLIEWIEMSDELYEGLSLGYYDINWHLIKGRPVIHGGPLPSGSDAFETNFSDSDKRHVIKILDEFGYYNAYLEIVTNTRPRQAYKAMQLVRASIAGIPSIPSVHYASYPQDVP